MITDIIIAVPDATGATDTSTGTFADHRAGIRKALETCVRRVRTGRHREHTRPKWRRARGRIVEAGR